MNKTELEDFMVNHYYPDDTIEVNCKWLQQQLQQKAREQMYRASEKLESISKEETLERRINILEASLAGLQEIVENRKVLNVSA